MTGKGDDCDAANACSGSAFGSIGRCSQFGNELSALPVYVPSFDRNVPIGHAGVVDGRIPLGGQRMRAKLPHLLFELVIKIFPARLFPLVKSRKPNPIFAERIMAEAVQDDVRDALRCTQKCVEFSVEFRLPVVTDDRTWTRHLRSKMPGKA